MSIRFALSISSIGALAAAATLSCGAAHAQQTFAQQAFDARPQTVSLIYAQPQSVDPQAVDPQSVYGAQPQYAPAEETAPEDSAATDPRFQRQIVNYASGEAPGTVIVDTPNTFLYYVLGNGQAIRYGIGVGREGFTWSGIKHVARKAEWPDWYPPSEMIARQPYLPRMTAGGPGNPLGARALYIGGTEYRIHGTNDPTTIGKDVSSGCIRLTNADIEDLYARVQIGAKVIVLPQTTNTAARQHAPRPSRQPIAQDGTAGAESAGLSYAPPTAAQRAWSNLSRAGLY